MGDSQSLLPEYPHGQFDSRHRLVLVAAQRAKQLIHGAKATRPSKFTKEATIALEEVLHGNIQFLTGKEARDAQRDAKRGKDADAERMAQVAGEDALEIKKELSVYVDDSSGGVEKLKAEE